MGYPPALSNATHLPATGSLLDISTLVEYPYDLDVWLSVMQANRHATDMRDSHVAAL